MDKFWKYLPIVAALLLSWEPTHAQNAFNIITCAANQIVYDNSLGQLVCSSALGWDGSTHFSLGSTGAASTIVIQANAPVSSGNGSSLQFVAANANTSGNGGSLNYYGGAGATNGVGGNVSINPGAGAGSGNGGSFSATSGTASAGTAGALNFTAGQATTSGTGGLIAFTGGSSGSGTGGAITFNSGAGSGGTTNGGGITIPGAASGSAAQGNLLIFAPFGADAAHTGNVIVQDFAGDNTLTVDGFGNVICACATATSATDQFFYIGVSAGAPTGVPAHITGVYANSVPLRYDTTNNKLWAYSGGWQNTAQSAQSYSQLDYQPGLITTLVNTKSVYSKIVKTSTVDNIVGSAQSLTTCTTNPTITMYECGTSATCASPTTIGSVTITATGQAFPATPSAATINAGDYVGWAISAGACASLDIGATAAVHTN